MKTLMKIWLVVYALNILGTAILHAASTIQFNNVTTITVAENGGAATLVVERANDTNTAVSVDYATTAGTATAGLDYTSVKGTLTFAAGETNQSFTVPILNDGLGRVNTNAQGLDNEGKEDESREHDIQFVVTGKDAAETFEPAKGAFDLIAAAIFKAVMFPGSQPMGLRWHHRNIIQADR